MRNTLNANAAARLRSLQQIVTKAGGDLNVLVEALGVSQDVLDRVLNGTASREESMQVSGALTKLAGEIQQAAEAKAGSPATAAAKAFRDLARPRGIGSFQTATKLSGRPESSRRDLNGKRLKAS